MGTIFSYLISPFAFAILLSLYFLNYLYSFRPFRFRNINFVKETTIFLIYFIKWFLISELLGFHFVYKNIPFALFIMGSSCAALSLSLYKRHVGLHKLSEYFYGLIFISSLLASFFLYNQIIVLFLPLLLIVIYLSIKYKNKQIPIGKYQIVYFLYTLAVYMVVLINRSNYLRVPSS